VSLRAPFSERELPKANDAAVNKNAISICIPSSPIESLELEGTGVIFVSWLNR